MSQLLNTQCKTDESNRSSKPLIVQFGMHAGRAGGVDRYFDGLMNTFLDRDLDAYGYVFGDSAKDSTPKNVTVLGAAEMPIAHRYRCLRQAINKLSHAHQGRKIVIANHFALYGFPLLSVVKKNPNISFISHFHGPWADESKAEGQSKIITSIKRLLESHVYKKSHLVLAVSKSFQDLAIEKFKVQPEKATFVPAGIDASSFFNVSSVQKIDARRSLGWPMNRKIIVCVRRLVNRVGVDRLIDAMKIVVRSHPDILLMIGGKGPLQEKFRSQILDAELSNHVQLLGFVPDADLPLVYRAADFSVVPSISLEGFGLIAIESLACGTPVLVTPVGGLPEVVSKLSANLILKSAAVVDIADGICNAIVNCQMLPNSLSCVEFVRSNYEWKTILPKLLEKYFTTSQSRCAV